MFQEWLVHPATVAVLEMYRRERERLKETWANGEFSDGMSMAMAIKNAGATGACSMIKEFLDITYEDLEEGLNNE